jgi:N-acyl homoserine lactone hydrolase
MPAARSVYNRIAAVERPMELSILVTGRIRRTRAPVLAYLIRDRGTGVLVDTGYPRDQATAGTDDLVEVRPGEDVVSRLASAGIRPGDIKQVICTHLDPDHAGNHDAFPHAQFVVQRGHLEWARGGDRTRLDRARSRWDRPELRYRLVDGDTELFCGVELISSGGHVPGHQSVLVRLAASGPFLLAADAIPVPAALDADTRPIFPFDMDEKAVRESTRKLTEIARKENARIICGHDPDAERALRMFPFFYN